MFWKLNVMNTWQRWSLVGSICVTALIGCGPSSNTDTSAGTGGNGAGGESLKVALVTPGDVKDAGWNQLADEGAQAIEKQFNIAVSRQVTKQDAEKTNALRDYADQNYNLVICHGFEYGNRVLPLAAKYPKTNFLVVAGNVKQEPNVATLVPKLEEATYLLGIIAGGMTKSNIIGAVGGMELPVIKSTFDAYEAGAKSVNPKVKVLRNFVGNFEDANKGKESAKQMIAQGADFIFHNADQAGKGVFNAASESKGVYVFGSNRDQNDVAADIVLASAVIDLPKAFVQEAQAAKDNKFKAELRELNMPTGTIFVAWNKALQSKIPPALLKKEQDAEAKIKSGALKIKRNV